MSTADDFRTARFATHPDGRIAARVCTGPHANLYPWRCSDIPGRSDYAMAEDGWSPLDETRLPRVVTDEMVRKARVAWLEFARTDGTPTPEVAREMLTAAWSAAPTSRRVDPQMTDEDALRVAWAEYRKEHQPIEVARAHEAFCEGWKERERWQKDADPTADEGMVHAKDYLHVVNQRDDYYQQVQGFAALSDRATSWQERAQEAEAFAARWKENARYHIKHERSFQGLFSEAIKQRDAAIARADLNAQSVATIEKQARTYALEQIEAAQAETTEAVKRAEKAEQERDEARAEASMLWGTNGRGGRTLTAREHLDAAWEAAYVPADGTIPARTAFMVRRDGGEIHSRPDGARISIPADDPGIERRLLDPPAPVRPEGAKAIEALLDICDDMNRHRKADFLAERLGVRAPEDGGER